MILRNVLSQFFIVKCFSKSLLVFNLNKIKNKLNNIDQYLDFILNCYHKEDLIFIDPYPGFIDFYYYFNLFFTKLNIKYENDSDSDSDSDDF